MTSVTGTVLYAVQPVNIISKNPSAYLVKQGPGQCGPASFYIVFRYYGHDTGNFRFSKGPDGAVFTMGTGELQPDKGSGTGEKKPVIIMKDSPVSGWMNGKDNSTDWSELAEAISNLYYVRSNNIREKFYPVIVSNNKATVPGSKTHKARKIIFNEMIVPMFLDHNRPVIVHLKRKWPYPGHYIVLIGYNSATGTVYYMNPNYDGGDIIKSVSAEDFTGSYWYQSDNEQSWGRAYWNGQWIGFYRD